MVTGIFLNSVVIISLWKSRQLRKQLCYFMILVLSCFDLAVVIITHPFLITSTIYYSLEGIQIFLEDLREWITFILYGFSMAALFTLNFERFLALTCPYFHQTSVTKTKLVCFQAILTTITIGLSPLVYVTTIGGEVVAAAFILLLLSLIVYANYKMFKIAKSKSADVTVASSTARPVEESRTKSILNLKNVSTCSLVVACFFFCSCPLLIYLILLCFEYDRQELLLFGLWSGTLTSMNSTLNCVIFFWRNSVLRREGMKIINSFCTQ